NHRPAAGHHPRSGRTRKVQDHLSNVRTAGTATALSILRRRFPRSRNVLPLGLGGPGILVGNPVPRSRHPLRRRNRRLSILLQELLLAASVRFPPVLRAAVPRILAQGWLRPPAPPP